MALTYYFSDTFRIHKVVDGVKVATYTPGGVPETGGDPGLVYCAPDGQGGVYGFGIPPQVGGAQAVGWHFDADLNVLDAAWGLSNSDHEWALPGGGYATAASSGALAFHGPGCVVDPATGDVYVLSYWREYNSSDVQIGEYTIAQFDSTGSMVALHLPSVGNIGDPYPGFNFIDFGGVSSGGRGAVWANGKIYALLGYYNTAGLLEYTPATQEWRIAFRCFDATNQPIDLAFDSLTGMLWMIDRYTSGGTLGRTPGWLHAYGMNIETDIPWGTDTVDATWTVLRPLFDGNSETGPYDDVQTFTISNGVGLMETNNVEFLFAWYTFDLTGGPLTEGLVHTDNLTDPYYYYGSDVCVLGVTPNLTAGALRRGAYFGRGR
jgi:hypothetical protein